jgi:hypothetical protein
MFWRDLRPVIQCSYLAHEPIAVPVVMTTVPNVLSHQGEYNAHGTIVSRDQSMWTAISCRLCRVAGHAADPEHVDILLSSLPISSLQAGVDLIAISKRTQNARSIPHCWYEGWVLTAALTTNSCWPGNLICSSARHGAATIQQQQPNTGPLCRRRGMFLGRVDCARSLSLRLATLCTSRCKQQAPAGTPAANPRQWRRHPITEPKCGLHAAWRLPSKLDRAEWPQDGATGPHRHRFGEQAGAITSNAHTPDRSRLCSLATLLRTLAVEGLEEQTTVYHAVGNIMTPARAVQGKGRTAVLCAHGALQQYKKVTWQLISCWPVAITAAALPSGT